MALLLDTSVLIQGRSDPLDQVAMSAVSIAELHFGVLVVSDDSVARECGRLYAALAKRAASRVGMHSTSR